jgi:Zn-dependent protease with chaperone function
MSKYAVWLLVVSVLGCGAPAPAGPQVVHSPCAPLVVAPPEGASPVQREALEGSLLAWNALGFTQLRLDGDGEPIALRFEKAAALFHGFYDPQTGEVFINQGLDDANELRVVIAHELGHAMGLAHVAVSERASVMNPGNLVTRPTPEDNALLVEACSR